MELQIRAIYRGQVTKISNAASEYLKTPESQINSANTDKLDEIEEELTVLLERLTAAYHSLCNAARNVPESARQYDKKECELTAEYEDKATSTIARLKQRIKKLHLVQAQKQNASSNAQQSPFSENRSSAKLPKLSLKTFSGDFKDWLPFWEIFRTAVHQQQNISGADKFNYLQAHLTGRAAESIAGFIPSDENYHAAISLLQEEYGDNERLIDHTMRQLMAMPSVSSRRDVHMLRKLYNSVISGTRSLTVLGIPSSQYSVMLKTLLLKNMPDELVTEFYRTCPKQSKNCCDPNSEDADGDQAADVASVAGSDSSSVGFNGDSQIKSILKHLKEEIESLERSLSLHTQGERLISQPIHKSFKTAAELLTQNDVSKCCFCQVESHTSQSCNTPMTMHRRKGILKKDDRCFRCLKKGHNSRVCKDRLIKCDKCQGRHSTVMCDPSYNQAPPRCLGNKSTSIASTSDKPTASLCSATTNASDVYLQTACALAANFSGGPSKVIRLILDGGSQRSYVTQNVVSKLGLKVVDSVKLRILPFGSSKGAPMERFDTVRVTLTSRHRKAEFTLLAVVVPSICIDVLPVPNEKCAMFTEFNLADCGKFKEDGLSVLIGSDYYWNIVYPETRKLTNSLVAINSLFGWTIQGPVLNSCVNESAILSIVAVTLNVSTIDGDVKRFWDLESVGIIPNDQNEESCDIDNYISRGSERYEASLLWCDRVELDNNREGAYARLERLIRKLNKDKSKFLEYDDAMHQMISAGIAEPVTEMNPISSRAERIYYMPHHPVYREDKTTTKMRIVFDASAHSASNTSLNKNLLAGPNLLPEILVVLLNFRLGTIGMVADIEKAFLQVSLKREDRDAHRFLWFQTKAADRHNLPPIVAYRMTRVV